MFAMAQQVMCTVWQSQKALAAYKKSKQLLPFGFVHDYTSFRRNSLCIVMCRPKSADISLLWTSNISSRCWYANPFSTGVVFLNLNLKVLCLYILIFTHLKLCLTTATPSEWKWLIYLFNLRPTICKSSCTVQCFHLVITEIKNDYSRA